ncbi:MAG: HAMP domain-containing protein, partial [Candidatus Omnitrophica bacterium]|nr:HAMP domain-containing protein [Candidatus Omnitrophota bacterium]
MRVKRSFRAKLILSYVLVVLISVGFIAVFLDKNLENRSLQEIKDSLFIQGNLVISQIEPKELISRNSAYLDNLIQKLSSRMQSRITLITPQGRVLADSQKPLDQALLMENHSLRPEVIQAMRTGRGEEIRYSSTLRIDMLYVALAIKDDADIIGILRLALPLKGVESTLAVIRKTIILSLVFALGFAFLLGSVLAASITRPVNRITGISRDFAKGDFRRRISISSADEIGELAATLNNMAQALEERIKQIQGQGQQLTAIFNSMVEGVIATDSRGRIISLNPPAEKIFSVKKDDILGKTFLEAIRNNDISEIINRTLRQRDAVSEELSLNWPLQRVFQVSASAIFENEKVSGCLLVIHDITEIRKLET